MHGDFPEGEEEGERGELLESEDAEGVFLGLGPDCGGEEMLREDVRETVDGVGAEPVEDFEEEGEFVEDAGVQVVSETGGIGGANLCEAAAETGFAFLGW